MRGWDVQVLERRSEASDDGRSLTLQPNGLVALAALDALDAVSGRGQPMQRVVFRRPDGRELATFDFGELDLPHARLVEIRPPELRAVLTGRLKAAGGELRLGTEVMTLDGVEADLVIGADGVRSSLRDLLGIGRRMLGPRGEYLLGTVPVLVAPDHLSVYCGRGFGDGIAPIPGATYFWDVVTDDNRHAVETRDLEAWRAVFAQRVFADGHVAAAVKSWSDLTHIAIEPFWARSNLSGRVLLVGDAAGAVHPHAAQGANLALEDAAVLGEAVAGGLAEEVLARYAAARSRRRRRFVLQSLLAAGAMDAPNRLWGIVQAVNFAGSRFGPLRRDTLRRVGGVR